MRLKISFIAALFLLMSATSLQAADMPDHYILYCKGEKASGFDWQSNDWKAVSFKPEDYIVTKSPNNKCPDFYGRVKEIPNILRTKEVCVNIRKAGEDYVPLNSEKCTEYYPNSSLPNSEPFVSCDSLFTGRFATSFNGWFHRSLFHPGVSSQSEYKDNLAIEVGKCSQIN